jgi:hypothetical protein
MTEHKRKWFYLGKYFETEEEFTKYVYEVATRPVTADEFKILFHRLVDDLWVNLSVYGKVSTGAEIREDLERIFIQYLTHIDTQRVREEICNSVAKDGAISVAIDGKERKIPVY